MNSNKNAISNDDADGKFSCPRNGTPWDQNMGTMIASDGDYMKLTARLKYDYRDLDRGEAQLIRVGHALWRDRLNWAIRSLKERALTRHLRASGRQRRNIGRNWLRRELCDSHSTWTITSRTRDSSEAPREFKEGEYRCQSQRQLRMKYFILWNARV
jgi:hypothetical protein